MALSAESSEAEPIAAQPERQTRYLVFIEGMRGAAALYVVLGHIASLVDPVRGTRPVPAWLHTALGPLAYGHLAVAAFIVISGFCLYLASAQRGDVDVANVRGFLERRCVRILPAYYGCLAVSILVSLYVSPLGHGMPFIQYLPATKTNVLAHVFMVQNLNPEWMYKLNGVLWSISIEFQIYFLFPLLARAMKRFDWTMVLAATVAFSLAVALLVPRGVKLYPWFVAFFFLGMIGARYAVGPPLTLGKFRLIGLLGLAACLTGTIQGWSPIISECGIALLATALLIEGTRLGDERNAASGFAIRPLAFIGAFSYSLYLMHHPLLQTLFIHRPRAIAGAVDELCYLLLFGLPVVLGLCLGFGLIFERRWVLKALRSQAAKGGETT
jgi:peptidoglycan/LPS O-acetylase OafA/YrhL